MSMPLRISLMKKTHIKNTLRHFDTNKKHNIEPLILTNPLWSHSKQANIAGKYDASYTTDLAGIELFRRIPLEHTAAMRKITIIIQIRVCIIGFSPWQRLEVVGRWMSEDDEYIYHHMQECRLCTPLSSYVKMHKRNRALSMILFGIIIMTPSPLRMCKRGFILSKVV